MTRRNSVTIEASMDPPDPSTAGGTGRGERPASAREAHTEALLGNMQRYVDSCRAREVRLAELWGPEPPYHSQAEDAASFFFGNYFYSWIGDFMYRAAKEEVKKEDIPGPTEEFRAYNLGRELSAEMQEQRYREHAWACLCRDPTLNTFAGDGGAGGDFCAGAARVRYVGPRKRGVVGRLRQLAMRPCFGAKTEAYTSCVPVGATGTLCWVGNPKQYLRQRQRFVGVDWDHAESWQCVAEDGSCEEGGEVRRPAPGELHDGTVGGEVLFRTLHGGATATCEPVECIEFLDAVPPSVKENVQRLEPRGMSVAYGLLRACGRFLWAAWRSRICRDVCTVSLPLVLKFYIQHIEKVSKEAAPAWVRGLFLVLLLFAVSAAQNLAANKYFQIAFRTAFAYRSALSGVIFEKCLTIASKAYALPHINPGRVTNMISNDCEHVNMFCLQAWTIFGAFVQLIMSIVMLYFLLGWAVFVGISFLALTMPLQYIISNKIFSAFDEKAEATDARLKATNEFISGIRVAKFMSWEPSFIINIERKRRVEVAKIKQIQNLFILLGFLDEGLPNLAIAVMFMVYSFQGHEVTAATVFPAISLLNVLSMPFHCIPMFMSACTQYVVSTNRICRFLECPDAESKVVELRWSELDAEAAKEEEEVAKHPGRAEADAFMRKRFAAVFASAGLSAHVAELLPSCETPSEKATKEREHARRQNKKEKKKGKKVDEQNDEDDASEDALYQLRPKELLHNVNLNIPRGKLTVILGPTGSGKSTLLDSLIGAVDVTSGRVLAARSVAYVPQQAWIMNATLRDNVLFFSDLDEARFERALDCSQLRADLSLLADGLETEIGEKGINLSGGQKARVGLARAVYADKELYLLDDPLSALDAHVGERVMRECVLGELSGKTRVLATHQTHFAADADYVVVLGGKGRVAFHGDAASYAMYAEMTADLPAASPTMSPSPSSQLIDAGSPAVSLTTRAAPNAQVGGTEAGKDSEEVSGAEAEAPASPEGAPPAKLVEEEEMAGGSVPLAVYHRYAEACGGVRYWALVLVTYIVTECLAVAPSVWLSLWSTDALHFNHGASADDTRGVTASVTDSAAEATSPTYVYVYMILTIVSICAQPVRRLAFYPVARTGSRAMHSGLIRSLASATMQFFDSTPLGRVVNRFSRDVDMMDFALTDDFCYGMQNLFTIFSSLALMTFTQPLIFVAVIPAGYVYYRLAVFFAAANRTIRRMVNVANAPVVALVTTIMGGRWTIEAYGACTPMLQHTLVHLDYLYATHYIENIGQRWLTTRVTMLSASVTMCIALLGIIAINYTAARAMGSSDSTDSKGAGSSSTQVGLISLSLTVALNFNMIFTDLISNAAQLESDMNSVERLIYYTDDVPHEGIAESLEKAIAENEARVEKLMEIGEHAEAEADAEAEERRVQGLPSTQSLDAAAAAVPFSPTTRAAIANVEDAVTRPSVPPGSLEFRHVDMRYRPGLPLVLRDVSFCIAPGQKVGVVGRTGSGKSTLLLAFLRLVEVCGGEMVVCGRSARTYDVRSLRQLFSMIPQDPLLFDGTVRSNVDPFGAASDAECWAALGHVGMAVRVRSEAGGLDGRVAEGGSNFSVGQRQLLCLARALLKRGSAFLLMDEATANVDPALDGQIQETVARTFRAYTVITIAHRLHTVAGYDMILMMDGGRVVACGSPRALVSDASSPFAVLVRSMGAEAQRKFMEAMRPE